MSARTLGLITATAALAAGLAAQAQPASRAGVNREGAPGSRYYSEFSYVLPSPVSLGGVEFGDVDTASAQISYQTSIPAGEKWSWVAGFEVRGTWFDVPGVAPIPDGLYETSLRAGALWRVAPDWRLQLMLSPGLYSDFKDIDAGDFNMPGIALAFWRLNERLELIGGLAVNPRNDVPVIPALGARWQFADRWTLLAVYPTPRVEFAANENWTFHAGAEINRSAYRVAEDFGDEVGRPELNGEDLSYNEWRVGAGARWRLAPAVSLALEGGWAGEREFVFDDRDVELEGDGAPYFQISISGAY